MDDNSNSADVIKEESSARSDPDKATRNKRKLGSDIPSQSAPTHLTEFPRYKHLAPVEEESQKETDWDEPAASQLQDVLTTSLFLTFSSSIKKLIDEHGCKQEAAEWAVLNGGLYHGPKDSLSNIVEGALALLKMRTQFKKVPIPTFKDVQSLSEYTLLEMIYILREVKPELDIVEAMWHLLMCDLNILEACTEEGDSFTGRIEKESSEGKDSKSKPEESETSGAAAPSKEGSFPYQEMSKKPLGISSEHRKGSLINSRRDMLKQKAFHFEKNYKGRMSRGQFKAKCAAWGSMILDRNLKSQGGSMKTNSGSSTNEVKHNPPNSSQSVLPSSKKTVFAIPSAISRPVPALAPDPKAQENLSGSGPSEERAEENCSGTSGERDYYAEIPYDESLQRYIPQDDKDESLLSLLACKQELGKELESWTDWANEKVMQAAKRLGKDQRELKMLRQEKEEVKKFNLDKKALEESTMKRLSEMEYALSNATGQIEIANCTVRRLEEDNEGLKKEWIAAKLMALRAGKSLQEGVEREQETLKKVKECEPEKKLLVEELRELKRESLELEKRIGKVKERKEQFKVLWRHIDKETQAAAKQADTFKQMRQNDIALTKTEEKNLKQEAHANVQTCKEQIKKLETMISELKFESQSSKLAALNASFANSSWSNFPGKTTKRLAVFEDNFGAGNVSQERECVMCLTEEISVVFLPCAHQVLCTECNVMHEKQGMDDCPSCRAKIKKRVQVLFSSKQ